MIQCLVGPQHCEHNKSDIRLLQGQEPSRIAAICRRQSRTLQDGIDQTMGTLNRVISREHDHPPTNQDPSIPRHLDCLVPGAQWPWLMALANGVMDQG